MTLPNSYALLGVAPTATEDEIWTAFHTKAAVLVRDRASEDYARLLDALQELTDPERRARLDARLRGEPTPEALAPAPAPQLPVEASRTPTLILRLTMDEMVDQARFREMAVLLDEEAKVAPPSAGRLALRAFVAFRIGDDALGFVRLKQALALDPACAYAHYALAVHVQQRGRAEDAWRILQWALPHIGGDDDLWGKVMRLAALLGQADGPVPALMVAIDDHPSSVQMATLLVVRLLAHDQGVDAMTRAKAVLARRPDQPDAWLLLARTQSSLGDAAGAEESCMNALDRDPGHAAVLLFLSRLYFDAMHPGTERMLLRAAAVSPRDPELAGLQGLEALRRGDLEAAERHLARALALDPASVRYSGALAEAQLRLGKPAEALPHARLLASRLQDSERGPFLAGEALLMLGRLEEAIVSYQEALHRAPRHIASLYAVAQCHASLGRPAEALGYLMALTASTAPVPEVLVLKARMMVAIGQQVHAEATWREVLSLDPHCVEAQLGLAGVLVVTGREDEAWAIMDPLMATGGDDPDVLDALARMWTDVGRIDTAVALWQRALVLRPGDRSRYEPYLDALECAGSWELLQGTLTQAMRFFPEDPGLILRLGRAYESRGLASEAVLAYRRYLRLAPRSGDARHVRARLEALGAP
ncbi:MAG: tetratricopeptide repeat protein [Candidatus Sericytochromatia bacterium]|nr:tetratricopeptide repeat protein [Candidatus Tanganyikabacteria bacterium]